MIISPNQLNYLRFYNGLFIIGFPQYGFIKVAVKSSLLWYKSPTDLLLMEEIRHPPVEVGSLSTMVYDGLILHPRWLLGISP